MNENPYAAPSANPISPESYEASPAAVRQLHLKHEASVKSIGTIQIFVAIVILGGGIFGVFGLRGEEDMAYISGTLIGTLILSGLLFWLGLSLRRLKPGVRIPGIIVSSIGLLGFPLGTLINAYFIYLLAGKKGKTVLSEEYGQVVAATPEIRYRTSIVVWVLLLILVLLIVVGIGISVSS